MQVRVSWDVVVKFFPSGTKVPDHFVITLGPNEANEPLEARSHLFDNVEPAHYEGAISVVAADGTEVIPPVLFSADAGVQVPTPVNISVQIA